MSCLYGKNRDIYFPKVTGSFDLLSFSQIAEKYLFQRGFEPHICASEEEARFSIASLVRDKRWPCYFFRSDTTGEKGFEEFFTDEEMLDEDFFSSVGIVKNNVSFSDDLLDQFETRVNKMLDDAFWDKSRLVELFGMLLPNFAHAETGKYLDQRM